MKLNPQDIEEIKNYFAPKVLSGKNLPNPKSVTDNTVFYKEESDGVFVEHIMFNGKWMRKEINASNQVILVGV